MVKPVFRRKSIGTKVSEEEYARLEALAGGRAMSEWTREVLLRELDGRQARPADETLLAEVLAVRKDPALRQDYQRLKFRRGHAVAKVAIARKLAVRMYWMLRSGADYARLVRRQGSPGATLMDASSSLG